jgi:hypothetical protein
MLHKEYLASGSSSFASATKLKWARVTNGLSSLCRIA